MTKFDFDYVENEGQDALQEVNEAVALCGGRITDYKSIGPGGGNRWFVVEVEHGEMFEVWLRSKGFNDPEEYRA